MFTLFCSLVAGVLLIGAGASAQVVDVYPVLDGGVVRVQVQAAAAVPDVADTASIGVVQMNAAAGETLLMCAPQAGPDDTVLFSAVTVENPGGGENGVIRGRAFSLQDCEGDLFADSVNTGYVRFVGPASPSLVDPDSGPPTITIP